MLDDGGAIDWWELNKQAAELACEHDKFNDWASLLEVPARPTEAEFRRYEELVRRAIQAIDFISAVDKSSVSAVACGKMATCKRYLVQQLTSLDYKDRTGTVRKVSGRNGAMLHLAQLRSSVIPDIVEEKKEAEFSEEAIEQLKF